MFGLLPKLTPPISNSLWIPSLESNDDETLNLAEENLKNKWAAIRETEAPVPIGVNCKNSAKIRNIAEKFGGYTNTANVDEGITNNMGATNNHYDSLIADNSDGMVMEFDNSGGTSENDSNMEHEDADDWDSESDMDEDEMDDDEDYEL